MKDREVWRPKVRRIVALVKKETRQMIRDPSTIAVGIVLPVILILLFGFGLSLDVSNVPLAVVMQDSSASAENLRRRSRSRPTSARRWSTPPRPPTG